MEWLDALRLGVSWLFLVSGGVFLIIGVLGMLRFPDFWARLHAASIIDTMGSGLIILGLMLQAGLSIASLKLLLIGFFIFIATPIAAHALAGAAYDAGVRPSSKEKEEEV